MDTYPDTIQEKYDHRDTYAVRLLIAAAAFAVFLLMHYLFTAGKLTAFDESVGTAIRSLRGPVLDPLLKCLTFLGNWQFIVGTAVIILILDLVRWHKANCIAAIAAAIVNFGLYNVLKRTIKRPRPDSLIWLIEEHGYSFPSGHSMNSMFCYGIMLYLVWRDLESEKLRNALTVLLCLLPPLIAFSRVYCGVHYPSDVIAGLSMGLAMLMVSTVLIDEITLRQTS